MSKVYVKNEFNRFLVKAFYHEKIIALLNAKEHLNLPNFIKSYPIECREELISSLLSLNVNVEEVENFAEDSEKKIVQFKSQDEYIECYNKFNLSINNIYKSVNGKFNGDSMRWVSKFKYKLEFNLNCYFLFSFVKL